MSYANVESHIPLATLDEVWAVDVFLEDTLLIILQVINIVDDFNSSTLSCVGGLADPHRVLITFFIVNLQKVLVFIWHDECLGDKVKHFSVQLLHFLYQSSQVLFLANKPCLWNVNELLVRCCSFKLT